MRLKATVSVQAITEYILLLFVILQCNSVYDAAIRNYHFDIISTFFAIVLLIVVVGNNRVGKATVFNWGKFFIPYYLFMLIFVVFSVTSGSFLGFFLRFGVFLPTMALTLMIQMQKGKLKIFREFTNLVFIICVISLFFWLFGSFLHFLHPNMHIRAFWGFDYNYPGYYGLYFERQTTQLFSMDIIRNSGFFTEGPMFALCVLLALAMELFLVKDEYPIPGNDKNDASRLHCIIYIVTMITISSTTAWILMIFAFVAEYYKRRSSRRNNFIFKILVSALVISIGVVLVYQMIMIKQNTVSWLIRLDDYRAGFRAWMDSPIVGNGIGTTTYLDYISSFRIRNTGFSNALFIVLSQGGVMLFLAYFFPLILCLFKSIKFKAWNITFFTIIVIIELVATLFQYTFLLMMLLSYFYAFSLSDGYYTLKTVTRERTPKNAYRMSRLNTR